MKLAYFDCFAGAAGDMMVAALIDAGCDFRALEAELARLGLADYRLAAEQVRRGGLAGVKFTVEVHQAHQPRRGLKDILGIIESAGLSGRAAERACAIFRRLGQAEAKVHGVSVDAVHFHEVGAVDSVAAAAPAARSSTRCPTCCGCSWARKAPTALPTAWWSWPRTSTTAAAR